MKTSDKEISDLYNELIDMPFPGGISVRLDELDLELVEHDAYIMGIASAYLKTKRIEHELDKKVSIDERIDECIEKLAEMRSYKQKLNELTELLMLSNSTM